MIECSEIRFTAHSLFRIDVRNVEKEDLVLAVRNGQIIREYPYDKPFCSYLILGWMKMRPVHIVVGHDERTNVCFVITVYYPDSRRWESDFKTRRNK